MKSNILSNTDFKLIKSLHIKKYRDLHNLFLIEGRHLAEEFLKSEIPGERIKFAVVTDEFKKDKLTENFRDKLFIVNENEFHKLSETKSPQGIMLVAEKFSAVHSLDSPIVALDSVNDPGNLGTIIRNSYWFNALNIIAGENSADVFNSKTIRASQGAVFHTSVKTGIILEDELASLNKQGYSVILTTMDGESLNSYKFSPDKKYVFVFGNEANGINSRITSLKNYEKVRIDGYSGCESLNVAVASGILLHHFRNCN